MQVELLKRAVVLEPVGQRFHAGGPDLIVSKANALEYRVRF